MKGKRLIILETLPEADLYVRQLSKLGRAPEAVLLAMNPNIRAFLLKHGLQSLSTAELMGANAFRSMMDQCASLERVIRRELETGKVQPPPDYFVNAFWHFLRLIWRHFLWNVELLNSCMEKESFEGVAAFKYPRVVTLSPWIEDDQLYMGEIAERMCAKAGIPFTALQPPPVAARPVQPERGGSHGRFWNALSYGILKLGASLLAGRRTILVPGFKYNMDKVCDDVAARNPGVGTGIFYLGKTGVLEAVHALGILGCIMAGRKIKKTSLGRPVDFAFPVRTFARFHAEAYAPETERAYMEAVMAALARKNSDMAVRGVELSDFLIQKIGDDVVPYMLDVSFQAFGLEKLFDAFKPSCVLSQMNLEIYGALGRSAAQRKIPSVLISHGSHVLQPDPYGHRENEILARNILVGDYRYSAVQSPLAKEMALYMGKPPENVISILPALWGRKVPRRKHGNGLTIVHAGTLKLRHNRRYIYETADEFLQGLQDLIEAVRPYPALKLILKIRPDIYELSLDTMKDLLPTAPNVVVEAGKPFLEVLEEADLVVSFSSTTIEEALSNCVPVLLYGGDGRYAHIPAEAFSEGDSEIRKAVAFVKDRKGLSKYMSRLNAMGKEYRVPEEAFRAYRFSGAEVVDLTSWISDIIGGKA